MNNFRYFLLFCLILTKFSLYGLVDVVTYSCNRPLQLEAFFESFYKYIKGYGTVTAICRVDKDYEQAYAEVFRKFKDVKFIRQSQVNPRSDFKPYTMDSVFNTPSKYILFSVDDLIMKDYVDLENCVKLLEKTRAYVFALRMGKNITRCFTENRYSGLADLKWVEGDVYTWQIKSGIGEWCYPNSLDGSIYLKSDIKNILEALPFNTPNTLEGNWSQYADFNKYALCFEASKTVNIPFNLVQEDFRNELINAQYSAKDYFSIENLLNIYKQGMRLDIEQFHKVENDAPHMKCYNPKFKMAQ